MSVSISCSCSCSFRSEEELPSQKQVQLWSLLDHNELLNFRIVQSGPGTLQQLLECFENDLKDHYHTFERQIEEFEREMKKDADEIKELTRAELIAIKLYTMNKEVGANYRDIYEIVNSTLSTIGNKEKIKQFIPYLGTLVSGLRKIRQKCQPVLVHFVQSKDWPYQPVDGLITIPKVLSCFQWKVSDPPTKPQYKDKSIFIVPYKSMGCVVPKGVNNKEHEEVIFEPGTTFFVVKNVLFELPCAFQNMTIFPPYFRFDRETLPTLVDMERAIRHAYHIDLDRKLDDKEDMSDLQDSAKEAIRELQQAKQKYQTP